MSQKTSIIGIGGAGCRIVSHITPSSQVQSSIVAMDTDSQALYGTSASIKLQLGEERVKGKGTSGDANLGRLAAEDDVDMIRTLFSGTDLALIVLGLGGGTATGAAPVVLRAARDAGALTLCFATLPFDFEAQHRRSQTESGIAPLRANSDALVLIPNQDLFSILGDGSVAALFERADALLGEAISGLWRGMSERGFYNPDFADVHAMLKRCGGACHLGYASTNGPKRVELALDALGQSALLNQGRVLGEARVALVSIMGGDDLAFKEVLDIRSGVAALVPEECSILLGTVMDETWKGRLILSVLMSEEWVATPTPRAPQPKAAVTPAPTKGRQHHVVQTVDAQPDLPFETRATGRFKGSEPTLLDGEDLDIPTYQRRHIIIER